MRSNPRTRLRRKTARAGFFNRRACVACAFLAFSLAVVHYRGDIPTLFPGISRESEPKLPNGSILFSAFSGNTCRQSLIDNATGQIRDKGFVDCDTEKAQTAEKWTKQMAKQRQTAIRDSFVNK
jgi:hypothetical protein